MESLNREALKDFLSNVIGQVTLERLPKAGNTGSNVIDTLNEVAS